MTHLSFCFTFGILGETFDAKLIHQCNKLELWTQFDSTDFCNLTWSRIFNEKLLLGLDLINEDLIGLCIWQVVEKHERSVASNEKESNFRGEASYYVMMKDYGGKPFCLCNNIQWWIVDSSSSCFHSESVRPIWFWWFHIESLFEILSECFTAFSFHSQLAWCEKITKDLDVPQLPCQSNLT